MYKPWKDHLEGVLGRSLGDFDKPCLLTAYKSWDDPPLPQIITGVIGSLEDNSTAS